MKILVVLTYYRPHTSGLTIYADRLANALIKRGHSVTVMTSRYMKELPTEEIIQGVRIVRAPVIFRLSKGVLMPTFGLLATKLILEHDVIHLHLPQLDAAGVAIRGRLLKKPTIITYHCDLKMPMGLLSRLANQAIHLMNNIAAIFSHQLVTYTQDYANYSPFLRRFKRKLKIIPPPVELPKISKVAIHNFMAEHCINGRFPIIGMAARFASEKGVEVLLNALPKIIKEYPNAIVWFAGPYKNIVGEEKYIKRLKPAIDQYAKQGYWKFVGTLSPEEMAAFYPNLNVLVIPSLNSTEAFGLVQIEAMMNSVPCVASDLPGVRQPVFHHKMGEVVPIADPEALSQAILSVVKKKIMDKEPSCFLRYSPNMVAKEYELLFNSIKNKLN